MYARGDGVAAVVTELREFRAETNLRFKTIESRVEEGFGGVRRAIDRLGSRWGIRNERLFRAMIAALLGKSFGATVRQLTIRGGRFDILISDGEYILVEIAASVRRAILERLERKRRLYTEATGVQPTRVVLATASIHSRRAHAFRQRGIEVIEPDDD